MQESIEESLSLLDFVGEFLGITFFSRQFSSEEAQFGREVVFEFLLSFLSDAQSNCLCDLLCVLDSHPHSIHQILKLEQLRDVLGEQHTILLSALVVRFKRLLERAIFARVNRKRGRLIAQL